MEDLLLCPFCGSDGLIHKLSNVYEDGYKIACSGELDNDCIGLSIDSYEESKLEDIDRWNKRINKK